MLFESKQLGRVSLVDDMREVFGAVFMWQGLPLNTKEPKDLEMAKGLIRQIKNKILMFSSEPKPLLLKGEIDIGQVYSTDGIQAHRDNPKIRYFIPKEGATLWTDNFAIPASSKKAAEAHTFINYFLDPQNAVKISKENLLATPNKSAKALLPKELTDDPNFYPSQEMMKKLTFMDDLGDSLQVMNRLWTELKSGG
jgi:spermidine/putrescine transport system substrate-binding protein